MDGKLGKVFTLDRDIFGSENEIKMHIYQMKLYDFKFEYIPEQGLLKCKLKYQLFRRVEVINSTQV